ncbi:MAG: NIPSNAP family protein [Chloroflexota bacterium]
MIYELRVYDCPPGRLPLLHKRFQEHTLRIWAKHGIRQVGFWEELIGQNNRLVYMLAYESLADRERRWDAFMGDPEWIAARAETEKEGAIVALVTNRILKPTEYSALK